MRRFGDLEVMSHFRGMLHTVDHCASDMKIMTERQGIPLEPLVDYATAAQNLIPETEIDLDDLGDAMFEHISSEIKGTKLQPELVKGKEKITGGLKRLTEQHAAKRGGKIRAIGAPSNTFAALAKFS